MPLLFFTLLTIESATGSRTSTFSRILDEEVLEVLDELNIPRVQTTDQLLARYVWKNEYFYCIDSTPRCFEHDYQAPNP